MHSVIKIRVDRNLETDVEIQGDEEILSLALIKVFRDISKPSMKRRKGGFIKKFLLDCNIDLGKHFDRYQNMMVKEIFDEQQFRQR